MGDGGNGGGDGTANGDGGGGDSTGDGGGRNGLFPDTTSRIVGGGILIIIIGGGISMLVIFLFKKKRKTISVGMLLNRKTIYTQYKTIPRCDNQPKTYCSRYDNCSHFN